MQSPTNATDSQAAYHQTITHTSLITINHKILDHCPRHSGMTVPCTGITYVHYHQWQIFIILIVSCISTIQQPEHYNINTQVWRSTIVL